MPDYIKYFRFGKFYYLAFLRGYLGGLLHIIYRTSALGGFMANCI